MRTRVTSTEKAIRSTLRARMFSRSKIYMVSTPLIRGESRIEAVSPESDQRRYWVPCPHCLKHQVLKFDRLRWPKGEPGKAAYFCEHCEQATSNLHKSWMLPRGEWELRPRKVPHAWVSPVEPHSPVGWYSWDRAVDDWEKEQKDVELLK
jgi:phage terminase large subunit GpA-like protein